MSLDLVAKRLGRRRVDEENGLKFNEHDDCKRRIRRIELCDDVYAKFDGNERSSDCSSNYQCTVLLNYQSHPIYVQGARCYSVTLISIGRILAAGVRKN